MIVEKIKITNNKRKKVTRICDHCSKKESVRMDSVWKSKNRRSSIDLCFKCSNLSMYKKNRAWNEGEKSHNWNGGIIKTKEGAIKIYQRKGVYEYEHRIVAKKKVGRPLAENEVVHHIDLDKSNNMESNLLILKNELEHRRVHVKIEKFGFTLLGKKIWFNVDSKRYTLKSKSNISLKDTKQYDDLFSLKRWKVKTKRKNYLSIYEQCYISSGKQGKSYKPLFHVLIAERKIGRRLFKNECGHHINNNSLDNSPPNLTVMTMSEHRFCHHSIQKCVGELIKKGEVFWQNI